MIFTVSRKIESNKGITSYELKPTKSKKTERRFQEILTTMNAIIQDIRVEDAKATEANGANGHHPKPERRGPAKPKRRRPAGAAKRSSDTAKRPLKRTP